VDQEEVGLGPKSVDGFLNGFLDVFKLGWEVSLLFPSGVEAWFTINVRGYLGSDPDSISLLSRSLDSFTSLLLGTVPLSISHCDLIRT